jgi:hypothetical protein
MSIEPICNSKDKKLPVLRCDKCGAFVSLKRRLFEGASTGIFKRQCKYTEPNPPHAEITVRVTKVEPIK